VDDATYMFLWIPTCPHPVWIFSLFFCGNSDPTTLPAQAVQKVTSYFLQKRRWSFASLQNKHTMKLFSKPHRYQYRRSNTTRTSTGKWHTDQWNSKAYTRLKTVDKTCVLSVETDSFTMIMYFLLCLCLNSMVWITVWDMSANCNNATMSLSLVS
jgi:hypothetical protein